MDDSHEDTTSDRVPVSTIISRATRKRLRVYCAANEVEMNACYEAALISWLNAREHATPCIVDSNDADTDVAPSPVRAA